MEENQSKIQKTDLKSKKRLVLFLGSAISALAVLLVIILGSSQNNYIAESAENIFYDQFFKWNTEIKDSTGEKDGIVIENGSYNDPSIIIADIDEKSLQMLGSYYKWDRSIHAKVIEHLSEGGAAAIAFDILFKDTDFGKKEGTQCYENITKLYPDSNLTDSVRAEHLSLLRSNYNFDSMLVEATRNSYICIVSFLMNNTSYYKYESDWEPLSNWNRAKEIGLSSTFELNQVDKPQNIESRQLLDNVFPELARAGARLGAVNAYPDKDGIVRRVNMFYKFPDKKVDALTPQRIYSTHSLMSILHLFHKDPKDVKIKMGEYIDIGKPFGIYRDSAGTYQTTFPNFTYPMFVALRNKMKQIKESGVERASLVEVTSKVTVKRDNEGKIVFDIFTDEDLHYNAKLSDVLRQLPENIFDKLSETEKIELDNGFTLSKGDEDDIYTITDEEDEEVSITRNILHTIHFFEKDYGSIKQGQHKVLSRNMDISYNRLYNKWSASIGFFSNAILKDILKEDDKNISALKPGEELRFGPYKKVPISDNGQYLIKYKGRFDVSSPETRTFKHVPYYEIYSDTSNLDQYAGKTVILGSSVAALMDIVNGPHEENIPAILVHANIIKNILEDDYLTVLKERYQYCIIILLAILSAFVGLRRSSYASMIIAVVMLVLYTLLAYICFKHNIYIGVTRPLIVIITSNTIAMAIRAICEFFEKQEIIKEKKKILEEKQLVTDTFKRFMSPKRIDKMLETGNIPQIGGEEESVVTAFFTDIQGFSTFSEKIGSPSKLVELLNEYLSAMTDILIIKNEGTLDKYEGDAIIAFFESSEDLELPHQAKRACDTALDMQNELLVLRKKWQSEGDKWPRIVHEMHMRIGINTGFIVTGYMGSNTQMNYTMMGDEVNLAARLESAAKQYGAYIHVSQNTMKELVNLGVDSSYIYRSLDIIRVVGKDEPVETFELLAYANDDNAMILTKLCTLWDQARAAYLEMDWDKAIELFTQCLDFEPHHPDRDPGSKSCPSQVYIKRCEAYKQNPPAHAGEKWDGIFTATEK